MNISTISPILLASPMKHFKYIILEDSLREVNHGKTTLVFASIVVAGALTGVALAILLQQSLAFRHQDVFALGTHETSVHGVNGVKGANGANGGTANGANG
ncbi:MAG: hypothetical protein WAM14_00935 [Candidatus Nitrosopolaris sp.]